MRPLLCPGEAALLASSAVPPDDCCCCCRSKYCSPAAAKHGACDEQPVSACCMTGQQAIAVLPEKFCNSWQRHHTHLRSPDICCFPLHLDAPHLDTLDIWCRVRNGSNSPKFLVRDMRSSPAEAVWGLLGGIGAVRGSPRGGNDISGEVPRSSWDCKGSEGELFWRRLQLCRRSRGG